MSTQTPLSHNTIVMINTGGTTESWSRIGKGFTDLTPTNNPTVDTKQYIDESNATTIVTATQRQYAYTAERVVGDAANDYIASLDDKIGDDLKTQLVAYNDYDTKETGGYPAKKYEVVVAVSNPGDLSGGATQGMSGTIYVNGDPTEGFFEPSTNKFTEA